MKKKRKPRRPATVKMPEHWKNDFVSATMRANFVLSLSQPMIEMLCAVADDVWWDRHEFRTIHRPDNWIATHAALEKRGMIVRKPQSEIDDQYESISNGSTPYEQFAERGHYRLTPAGEAVVQLLTVTGVFVEQDAATRKKARKRG